MSTIEKSQVNTKIFLKIVDGTLRQEVTKETVGAVKREWKAGGEVGEKWELPYPAVSGRITEVSFFEGEKDGRRFQTLNIQLDQNEDGYIPVISVSTNTKYARDIFSKLPSVHIGEEVRIRPYKFLPDGQEKEVVGVEITQRGQDGTFSKKVDSYFFEPVHKNGVLTYVPTHGFPVRNKPWSEQSDADREIYRIQVRQFLIDYIKENIIPKLAQFKEDSMTVVPKSKEQEDRMRSQEEVEEGINIDDIPF